ncbi:phytoene desaturase family protein [Bacteroidota bacterium]
MAEKAYDTVIVGGGIAGLTSAAYLTKKGQKVLLIEKNKECGGLVNSFNRNSFHFDAGVRALLDAGIIFPMLKELGIELDVVKSPVSIGVENEILHIEDINSLREYKNLLKKIYPESEAEIDHVIKIIRKVMKHMDVLYGIENPVIKDLWKEKTFIFKTLLPWLPKFLFTIRKINRMNMPVEEFLKTIVKDASLRDIISQHFFKSTPTFFALSYFSLYLDYFYPKGGVGKLAEAFENKLIESGGEIKTETAIQKVMAGDCIVIDQDKLSYKYNNLIWAADLKTFYKITEIKGLSEKAQSKFENVKTKMLAHRGGDSVYTLFVEVNEPLDSFKRISNGHFFYTPSKIGLGETHREELNELLDNWEKVSKEQVIEWLDKFTRLNTYEISVPGLKDPELAPKGKSGLAISFLTEYDLFQRVHQAGWYEEFISEIEKRVLKVLSDSVYPMLKEKVIGHYSFTPLSIQNRVGSSEGAITGWSFQEPIPVINKIQAAKRAVVTPIPSIYQAGQWTYSPAGVPMSILTGKLAADKILNT